MEDKISRGIGVNKILVITLSNIGDVILTTPVLEVLYNNFPDAYIAVICSKRTAEFFLSDPRVNEVIIYFKHTSIFKKFNLARKLRKKKFDVVLDLRHTLFPLFIGPKYRTSVFNIRKNSFNTHKRDFHLNRLKELKLDIDINSPLPNIYVSKEVKWKVDEILKRYKLTDCSYIVINPGGRSKSKLWAKEKFLKLCKKIINNYNYKILLVGDIDDDKIARWIFQNINVNEKIVNLAGKTSLLQLTEVLRRAQLLITNDSGILHIGSAAKVSIIAIFGPTNEYHYGPLGKNSIVVKSNMDCRPCVYAKCIDALTCLDNISVSKVYEGVERVLKNNQKVL